MRCPWCGREQDRVVDSRSVERGNAVRRRRQCVSCRRRYTTFERIEDVGLTVIKRDGTKEQYRRDKVVSGIEKALKNRPVNDEQITAGAPQPRGKVPEKRAPR